MRELRPMPRPLLQLLNRDRPRGYSSRMTLKRWKISQPRKWRAYLKLEGETAVNCEEDIAEDFSAFVQTLRGILIDYNIVVFVEPPKHSVSPEESTLANKGADRQVNA